MLAASRHIAEQDTVIATLQGQRETQQAAPSTPLGMVPIHTKPNTPKRRRKPGARKVDLGNDSAEWQAFAKKLRRLPRNGIRLRKRPDFTPERYRSRIDRLNQRLTEVLRHGAQRLLGQAIEAKVDAWIECHRHVIDEHGHREVVRNGHLPTRTILTGVGSVEATQPRVHDRRPLDALDDNADPVERFPSKILPPYLRKTESVEELIPWLYVKGRSTGDFTEALQAVLGPGHAF